MPYTQSLAASTISPLSVAIVAPAGPKSWRSPKLIASPGWNPLRLFLTWFGHFLTVRLLKIQYDATGALRVYNLTRTAGFQPSTAALATTMQLVSFVVVLLFFRLFGSRYLKGTYLI